MPGKRERPVKPSQSITPREQIDELNVYRLGLISVQERVPDDFIGWDESVEIAGVQGRVTCVAVTKYKAPHGVDNDVFSGCITRFRELGMPQDGRIITTAYLLLRASGMDINGASYEQLKESLHRLWTTSYQISQLWRDHARKRWTTQGFRIIENLEFTTGEAHDLDADSVIVITLAPALRRSIQTGYIRQLDPVMMRALKRRSTRAIYRWLDARRRDPADPDRLVTVIEEGILDVAKGTKIVSNEPDKIRRALDPAHEDMQRLGYLKSVTYIGRGVSQRVRYEFGTTTAELTPDAAFEKELEELGVKPLSVRTVLRNLSGEEVRQRVELAQRVLSSYAKPPRNRGALAADVLRHPEKYALSAAQQPQLLAHAPLTPPSESNVSARANNEPTPPEVVTSPGTVFTVVKFMLSHWRDASVSARELDTLQRALLDGRMSHERLYADAIEAQRSQRDEDRQRYIARLKDEIANL